MRFFSPLVRPLATQFFKVSSKKNLIELANVVRVLLLFSKERINTTSRAIES